MKKIQAITFASLLITSLFLISCGEDDSVVENQDPVLTGKSKTYTLAEVDGSGVSGSVKLEEYDDESTKITISVTGTSDGNTHPAHIHLTSDASIIISLTSVSGASGESVTEVAALNDQNLIKYSELVALNAYVNVHLSATDLSVVATGGLGGFEEVEEGGAINYDVTNSGSSAYIFNGNGLNSSSNPNITLKRGSTYTFTVNTPGHPFLINTTQGTGTGNEYSDGVTGNGTQTGTVTFVVPANAPSTLFYNCEFHSSMTGTITIED